MTTEQILILSILALLLGLFVWGKLRYDIVAIGALILATLFNLVPVEMAFSGFAHPAVITVAAVLVVSRGLMNSGIVDFIVRSMSKIGDNPKTQLLILMASVTFASAFMNNIAALALFMPVAIKVAREHNHPPSIYLMPLAFGSLLGGMVTLIGTPPNIIISSYRSESLNQAPFNMFAFAPVGGIIAIVGLVFIVLFGPYLMPKRKAKLSRDELFEISDYLTEVIIPEKSKLTDKRVRELERFTKGDLTVVGHIREGERFKAVSLYRMLRPNDQIIIKATANDLQDLLDASGLKLSDSEKLTSDILSSDEISVQEVSITATSNLLDKTARSLNFRSRYGINLIGVARSGGRIRTTPAGIRFKAGDVLLLQGSEESLQDFIQAFHVLPLQTRNLRIGKFSNVALAIAIFLTAILLAAFSVLPIQIAFVAAALVMVLVKFVPLRELYESIEWPIIILLAALIPVSTALETTGTATLIADQLLFIAGAFAPWVVLGVLITLTMLLSNVINNAAAALLMAPIAVGIALGLNVSLDPFLMAVAIGASSAFLTPIGHQSNTLVMGPGGYKFSDYSRLGIPVSILIIVLSIPLILVFWPL